METHISTTPAKDAGEHISKLIREAGTDVLVLLSGGSALDVFEYIQVDKSECRTIFMMGDERVTGEVDTNNYSQLKTRYSSHPLINDVLDTSARKEETPEFFATRIQKLVLENISKLTNVKIILLLGVGRDGHTAGIFPLPEDTFRETYKEDVMYAPVHHKTLTIDSRASFTPSWILSNVDDVFGYITTEAKKQILDELMNESKEIHERPAELLKIHKNSFIYTDIGS